MSDLKQKVTKTPVLNDSESPELLATAIEDVARAARILLGSRLTMRAIVLLIQDHSGVKQGDIKRVLESAANLGFYLKPRAKVPGK